MQMEGKKKKGKERERRRAQGVCQARRTCVVCVSRCCWAGRHCWQSPCGPSLCGVQVQSRYEVKCLNTDIALSPSLSLFFLFFSFFFSFLLFFSRYPYYPLWRRRKGILSSLSLFSLSLSLFLSFFSHREDLSMGMGIKCRNQRVNTSWSSPRITEETERERERREKRGYGWLVAIVRYVTEHKNTK